MERVRLLDFELPEEMLAQLPGPRFGIKGVRGLLGLGEGEVMIATILKPCAGLTPKEVAEKCYQAALGGVDFIKDDEKMNNPPYCPLREKVRLVSQALGRAQEKTGRRTIYCPHISTRADKIRENALAALEEGATGLMINIFATGFAGLQVLAEDPDLQVPIYVHSGGRTAWSRFPGYGIDLKVVARLCRLLGADFFRAHMLGGYLIAGAKEEALELVDLLRRPMGQVRDTIPALSGGLDASNLVENLEAFGPDILPMAGGAILDHPMGIKAGVMALRQAAEAHRLGIALSHHALHHPELAAALGKEGRPAHA